MPEVLLFGATGYTGRLTAHALARRGADFVIAGRNRAKLEELAAVTGDPEIRIAAVGDVDALVEALDGVSVLITCVGPFAELGMTAVEAALRAQVHYIDSTGEGPFIRMLIEHQMDRARTAGIAMVPAMGFDDVPADCAATLASAGMTSADVRLTYALPKIFTVGTMRSIIGIAGAEGPWLDRGQRTWIRAAEHSRWAPLPPPLGPKPSVSFPLAEAHLAPLHLDVETFHTYLAVSRVEEVAMKIARPTLGLVDKPFTKAAAERVFAFLPEGPTNEQRRKSRWTILAEARSGSDWRNVSISGTDVYGVTAEFLSAGAVKIAREGPLDTGVVAPVQAVGIETFEKEFADHDVTVDTYEAK